MEGLNQGNGITGTAHAVGSKVTEFHPGDRMANFHAVAKPGGGYTEYPLTPPHMTFHIPSATSFEEAATVPLTAMTAVVLLYSVLGLPQPLDNRWGRCCRCVRSAVGEEVGDPSADLCCGEGVEFAERLIDRAAEDVVGYRKPSLVEGIRPAVPEGQS
jgi:NADPH2:quinone reductase